MGRIEADREITSEPWSPREGQQRNQRRPLFGEEGVLRSKNEKSDKKFQKSPRKDLAEPTLLEITGQAPWNCFRLSRWPLGAPIAMRIMLSHRNQASVGSEGRRFALC